MKKESQRTLLLRRGETGWWYRREDQPGKHDNWQFGGETVKDALDQAHERMFITVGDWVKNEDTGEETQLGGGLPLADRWVESGGGR